MTSTDRDDLIELLTGRFAQIGRQFAQVHDRFGQMDDRFDRIDQRFGGMDLRFEQIDERLDRVDQRFEEMDRRFVQVDQRITALHHHLDTRFLAMDRRFDAVDGRFGEIGHLDEIYRRLERLEQEYYAIAQQLRRIEAALTDESGRREMLERDLAALKEQMVVLQFRIAEIERHLGL